MVNIPKTRNTYCRKCRKHTGHKVSQYKTGKASLSAQGKRRYDKKQAGFGGQTKPVFHKKAEAELRFHGCELKTGGVLTDTIGTSAQGLIRAFIEANLLEGSTGFCAPEWAVYRSIFDDIEAALRALKTAQCEGRAQVWGVATCEVSKALWLAEQARVAGTEEDAKDLVRLPSDLVTGRRISISELKRTVSHKWEERAKRLLAKLRTNPRPFWGARDVLMNLAMCELKRAAQTPFRSIPGLPCRSEA
ncbi:unnamed protein product [Effrenium voratum]|nr:unnamed protein product [Effrenium voratum]